MYPLIHFVSRLAVGLLALLAPKMLAQTPPTNLQLFLLMGQSNMAGRGEITAQDLVTHPRIWMLTQDNQWVPARDPVHYDRSYAGVGLASEFARDLAAAEPTAHIGLIPTAVGGSTLSEWAPGTAYYNNAIARTRAAFSNGTLAGILWHQGESDATASGASAYLAKFAALIGRLRADLNAYGVPVVAGELGLFRSAHGALNPTLARIPERIPLAGFARAGGLTHKGDGLHFNTPSLYEFGHRYILQWGGVGSWRNYEAERLSYRLSGGSRVVSSEVQASEGKFFVFQPSSFGQYAELTLPDVPAGTYAVKFRFHRHPERGRGKVTVEGVPLGGEIDQYAGTSYSSEAALGLVTLTGIGNRLVRITSTSSATLFKKLSVDAIILEPQSDNLPPASPTTQTLEGEGLPMTLSGGSSVSYGEQPASGGRWLKYFPTAFGQSITFTLSSIPAGTYEVKFRYKRDPDRGRCAVWLDGAQVREIEQYAAAPEFVEIVLGTFTWTDTGSHTVRLTSSSSSGTSKNLAVDAFTLVPKVPQKITFESDVLPRSLSGGSAISYGEQPASGGRWLKYFPTAFGQTITFTLGSVPAGAYEVRFRYKRDPDRGRCTVWLDGAQVHSEIEQYAPAPDFVEVVLGTFTWTSSGSHAVRLTSSGSSGTSKNLAIDSFIFIPR